MTIKSRPILVIVFFFLSDPILEFFARKDYDLTQMLKQLAYLAERF